MSGAGLLAEPEEVRAVLVAAARAGEPITYSEVLALLGFPFSRPKMRQLCKVLGFVDQDAARRGEPELAVLVVRQSDSLPGQGWWIEGCRAHSYDGPWEGPSAQKLIRRLHAAAFDYWRESG